MLANEIKIIGEKTEQNADPNQRIALKRHQLTKKSLFEEKIFPGTLCKVLNENQRKRRESRPGFYAAQSQTRRK
ncbi:hypothetical protein N1Z90_00019480 [Acinetobacter baumannii]